MAAGIERHIDPAWIHVLEVFHLVGTTLKQKALLHEYRNIGGRGHHDVETMAACFYFGESGIIRIVVGYRHFDIVLLFEFLDQIGVRIVAPVEDMEFAICQRPSGKGGHGKSGGSRRKVPFHRKSPCLTIHGTLLLLAAEEEENCHKEDRNEKKGGRNSVHLRRHYTAQLAQHVGGKGVLTAGLHELGYHDIVE